MKKLLMIVALGLLLVLGSSPIASAAYVDMWLGEDMTDPIVLPNVMPGEEFEFNYYLKLSDWDGAYLNNANLGMYFEGDFVFKSDTKGPLLDYLGGYSPNGNDYEAQANLADGVYKGPEDLLLATLTFTAPDVLGEYSWTTYDVNWFPPPGNDIFAYDGTGFDDVTIWHEGTINVVPIPGAVFLLGSGLVGLWGVSRRKKMAA